MLESLTLDQLRIFVAVVEEGSFSAAGRRLKRVQSAISYGIAQMEGQIRLMLFDRKSRVPSLTAEGKELFLEARRVLEQMEHFQDRAMQMVGGLEPEVSLVVDAMFPMPALIKLLRQFAATFPAVSLRLRIEALGATWASVLEGESQIGVALVDTIRFESLKIEPIAEVTLLPVIAADHPLGKTEGPIRVSDVRHELQIVVTDRSKMTEGQNFGVLSDRIWRVADLSTKHALLLAGLGWGNMPYHMIHEDLQKGRLTVLSFDDLPLRKKVVPLCSLLRRGESLGSAGRWLFEHLSLLSRSCMPHLSALSTSELSSPNEDTSS